jgi:uncharacterized membrane protein
MDVGVRIMKLHRGLILVCALAFLLIFTVLAFGGTQKVEAASSRAATFNIYVSEENKTEEVNETTYVAFFSISLENMGDSLGDVTMYMTGFPSAGWDWQPNPGGEDHKIESVWPGETKWVSLVIYAPLTETAGTYNLYMSVKPEHTQNEIVLTAKIPQKGGIEVVAPPNVETEPGTRMELPFTIENTGNGEDTFTILRVDISKPTWDVEVVGGFQTGKVKPHKTTTKIVKVTIPYEAEATEPDKPGVRVSITAVSNYDADKQDGRGTYIKILQFWSITFNVDKVNETTRPGERIDFNFVVRNDGNGQDNVTLRLEHNLDGWSIGLTQFWFNLSKDTGRSTTLTIIPSERAIRGDYWLTIYATSTGPPESPDEESRTLLVTIEEVFNVTMDIDTNVSLPMPPGGVAEYMFTITNNGNTNDYVTLEVLDVPDGWFVTLDSEGVPLGPGQSKDITLTVLASPRIEEAPSEKYYFSVVGVSDGLPDVTQYINVTCEISPVGKIDFGVTGDDTIDVNPYQKENYNFIFDVQNKGNCIDEMTLSVSSWSWDPETVKINPVFYPNILSISRYTTKQARLEVTVPRGTPLGYYDITVIAMSTLNPSSTRTAVVHVKVIQEDVTVQPIKFKRGADPNFKIWKRYQVEEGEIIYIGVPVSNNGSEVVHDINLKVYQDSKVIREDNITSLGLLKTVVITVQWKANFLGEFNIKAVASLRGDSNKADNTVSADVKVVESLTPEQTQSEDIWSLTPGSPLFLILVLVVIMGIGMTIRYMLSLRSEQTTRDLYESIYGDDIVGREGGGGGPEDKGPREGGGAGGA